MDLEQNELPICPAARVCEESLHFERDASPALAGRPRPSSYSYPSGSGCSAHCSPPMKEKPYVAGKLNTANGKAARREKEDSAEGHSFANANQASRGLRERHVGRICCFYK